MGVKFFHEDGQPFSTDEYYFTNNFSCPLCTTMLEAKVSDYIYVEFACPQCGWRWGEQEKPSPDWEYRKIDWSAVNNANV